MSHPRHVLTLSPLNLVTAVALRAKALEASSQFVNQVGGDATKWTPLLSPVTQETTFHITEHATTNPEFPTGVVYFIAVAEPNRRPYTFGLAPSLIDAESMANLYMAAPTPGKRYGYITIQPGGQLWPSLWTSKNARERYFANALVKGVRK
ncbi:hypothetical protein CGLAR1_09770 [Corynebacterium glutamicum]|uniref:hypothetical protein n=1 Tax=Corynebacterium glutamicum TaxID=1718 RepID=UPI0004F748A1|nr:hypothetical protein [Corynebacterium glutamicum]AIK85527.1 hypothetical protein CGLAR1_09770 [Corynebacterium glutamicum]AIK88312.1 hypothetical protein AR0_09920 [Corynebacterium glutamicum]